MHWTGFAARRARSRLGLLAASALIVAVTGGTLVGIAGTLGTRVDDGIEQVIEAAPPSRAAVRVTTVLGDDPAAQNAQVEESLDAALGDAPVTVVRSVRLTEAEAIVGDRVFAVVVGSEDPATLEQKAELVSGSWPAAGEVVVHATAADELGLEPGDSVTIAGAEFTVSGLWAPIDAADPTWFSDPAVGSGWAGGKAGPLLITESDLAELGLRAEVRWTVVPSAGLTSSGLATLAEAVPRLQAEAGRLRNDSPDPVNLNGELAPTVQRASRAAGTVTGVVAVPLVLLAILGGIVLALVARALAAGRGAEDLLLRGRGLSRSSRSGLAVVEAVLAALAGAALGVGVAAVAFGLDPALALLGGGLITVAAAVVIAVTVVSFRPRGPRADDSGRLALVAGLAPLALAALAATIATVQFIAVGTPVAVRSDGGVRVDPLALAAPALLLVAFGLAAQVLATPLLAIFERIASKGIGLLPALPARQLARRTRTVAAALLVVVLGTASVTFAAVFAASAATADETTARLATGADVRVALEADDGDEPADPARRYAELDGVDRAFALTRTTASIGRDAVTLLVADPDDLVATLPAPLPAGADLAADGPLPIVATRALADRIGVAVGDSIAVILGSVSEPIECVIVGVMPALPTTGSLGILAEPGALRSAAEALDGVAPELNEVWIETDDPDAVAAQVRTVTTRGFEVTTRSSASDRPLLDIATSLTWVGALACLLLALVGFAAVAAGLHRDRTSEGTPLRSLGFGAVGQARSRAVELTLTGVTALLLGVGVGLGAAAVAVPTLAGPLVLTPLPWLVAIAAFALGLAAVGVIAALRVHRDVSRGGRE